MAAARRTLCTLGLVFRLCRSWRLTTTTRCWKARTARRTRHLRCRNMLCLAHRLPSLVPPHTQAVQASTVRPQRVAPSGRRTLRCVANSRSHFLTLRVVARERLRVFGDLWHSHFAPPSRGFHIMSQLVNFWNAPSIVSLVLLMCYSWSALRCVARQRRVVEWCDTRMKLTDTASQQCRAAHWHCPEICAGHRRFTVVGHFGPVCAHECALLRPHFDP